MLEGAGEAQPQTRASPLGAGGGGARAHAPVGCGGGRRWRRASAANPNLIFPGPTPVSMETARSRNGNQNPEMRSLELPFAFLDSCSPPPRDAGWVLATGHPRCSRCIGVQGWPSPAPQRVRVLLRPHALQHPRVGCEDVPPQAGGTAGRGYGGRGETAGRGYCRQHRAQASSDNICTHLCDWMVHKSGWVMEIQRRSCTDMCTMCV